MIVLVTGATGLLGGYVVAELGRVAARAEDAVVACGGPGRGGDGLDLEDAARVDELVARVRPDVILHTAALSAMADCARDPALARRINVDGAAHVARAAQASSARLVHVSTDMVFDGESAPYAEGDAPTPTSVYGQTKRDAETAVLSLAEDAVVVRVSLLFGPTRTARQGFYDLQLERLRASAPLTLFDDEWRTPLSLLSAAEGLAAVAREDVRGVLHLGGPERMSRYEMGVRLARAHGLSGRSIASGSRTAVQSSEPRPRDLSLESGRFHALPSAQAARLASGSFEEECRRMAGDRGGRPR